MRRAPATCCAQCFAWQEPEQQQDWRFPQAWRRTRPIANDAIGEHFAAAKITAPRVIAETATRIETNLSIALRVGSGNR
jgi:hypothetical protein